MASYVEEAKGFVWCAPFCSACHATLLACPNFVAKPNFRRSVRGCSESKYSPCVDAKSVLVRTSSGTVSRCAASDSCCARVRRKFAWNSTRRCDDVVVLVCSLELADTFKARACEYINAPLIKVFMGFWGSMFKRLRSRRASCEAPRCPLVSPKTPLAHRPRL